MDAYIGMIQIVGFNFAPRNWMLCNGQLLAIQTNTALFSLLGVNYGGNGTTTFGLPNLQGKVMIGQGTGAGLSARTIGQTGGATSVSLLTTNIPSHTHTATVTAGTGSSSAVLNAVTNAGNTTTPTGNYLAVSKTITNANYNNSGTVVALKAGSISNISSPLPNVSIGSVGASLPVSIMQPSLALTHVICLYGIFPSRN